MEIKPGQKTTEFVLALAPWILALAVIIGMAFKAIDVETGLILLAGLGIGGGYASGKYAESRGMVKAGSMLPMIEEIMPTITNEETEK